MLHKGEAVLDKKGPEKEILKIEDILGKFNQISIECGN
jgi:putative ABC transport system ATP-binding protein